VPFCSQCGTENPDVAKFCFACGSALVTAAPPAPPQEVRKVVSIVFSDLKGSTAMGEKLDSESLREVMTRYFDAMSAELERHGGVVEKFIGDAIMAVFGLPTLHEDDALRAVRAAAGMQRALGSLNDELDRHWGVRLTVRTGVNTGQVVAGDPTTGQRLVTGDAVNVAARLEQAAGAQEILLGDLTYRLVRDYVDVEEVEPLELKGKSERVRAYRLVGVREDAERARRIDSPMVGRENELRLLRGQLQSAIDSRTCRLATVVGEAGVGKSRLIDELVGGLADDVVVLRGRCLPYGEGITFWPLAEAVRDAARIAERDTTEVALEKIRALAGDDEVAERVASAVGLSSAPFPGEELVWGARRLLESLGRGSPVLALFEDVHWAEPTFLELIEQVVAHAVDAQLVVVCTGRHELLERLPAWSTGERAVRVVLERLSEEETAAVAEHLLGMTELDGRIRERIIAAAEGNPLFVEQLLSMLIDDGVIVFESGAWRAVSEIDTVAVPPTIHALLAARLDGLAPDERAVIEPAAVIGQLFVRDAVDHLAPERVRPALGTHLGSLTEKHLVQPDRSRTEEEAFRFHHILIRDTAYDGILKRARATFHEQFVEWADSVNREGATEYEEILGYHLEQAHRYLAELGPLDDHGRELGADGARRLASAGRRAFARGDAPAAAKLLGRAASLLPETEPVRLALLAEHGDALMQAGSFQEAELALDEAIGLGESAGAPGAAARASLVRLLVRLRTGELESWQDEAAETIVPAMAVFEEAGDAAGLAMAWRLLAWTHGTACRFGDAAEASERALAQAELAGDVRQQTRAATAYAAAAIFGPTPVSEAIARCESVLERVTGDRQSEGVLNALLASLLAMRGEFDRARELSHRGRVQLEELGLDMEVASVANEAWRVEMLAGDPVAAERELRSAYDLLTKVGEKYFLSTVAGLLAQTLHVLERYEEAAALADLTRELATDDDISTQALWRCVQAKLLARNGSFADAEALARHALAILEPTDHVLLKYGALLDLAEVRRLAGQDAQEAVLEARRLADAKSSPVMVAAAEALLATTTRARVSS
jgi:class 3 adenylate cyclase/tetratricopeptide (TPR) repeat protein